MTVDCQLIFLVLWKGFLNWEYVIPSYIVFAGVMIVLIRFIHLEIHQKRVDELELQYSEKFLSKNTYLEPNAPLEGAFKLLRLGLMESN